MTAALNLPDKQEWTVDDLASLPKDLRYELIDGRLIWPSPTAIHQDIALEVLLALRAHCPPDLLVVHDLSLKVDYRNEPRPDVVVIRPHHADVTPLPVGDAVLAVEVVSTWSLIRDMYAKATVYAGAGVGSYWVIQPIGDATVLTEFRPGDNRVYEIFRSTDKIFTTDLPYVVTIDLPGLTARRKAILEQSR